MGFVFYTEMQQSTLPKREHWQYFNFRLNELIKDCTETFIPLDRGDSRGALVLVTHKWTFREQRDWNDKKRYPILLEDIVTDEMWHGTTQVFSGPNECYEEDKHIDLNNVAFGYVEH